MAYGDIALPAGMAGGTISGLFDGGRPLAQRFHRCCGIALRRLQVANFVECDRYVAHPAGIAGRMLPARVSEWLRTVAKMAGLDRFSMHRDSGKNRYRRFQRARAGLHFLQPNLFRVFT